MKVQKSSYVRRIVDEAVGEGAGPNAAAQTHEDDGAPDHVKVDPLLQLRSHVARPAVSRDPRTPRDPPHSPCS